MTGRRLIDVLEGVFWEHIMCHLSLEDMAMLRLLSREWKRLVDSYRDYRRAFMHIPALLASPYDHASVVYYFNHRRKPYKYYFLNDTIVAGYFELVKWLCIRFRLTARQCRNRHHDAFSIACIHGHLDIAQWLHARFGLMIDPDNLQHLLQDCCTWSSPSVVEWLCMEFKLAKDDACYNHNINLFTACREGRVEIIRVLFNAFQFTVEDARTYHGHALQIACEKGHADVVMLLCETLKFTQLDLCYDFAEDYDRYALPTLCRLNNLPLLKWIYNYYGLEAENIHLLNAVTLLACACKYGHLAVAMWLHNQFQFTELTVRKHRKHLFDMCCSRNQLDVLQWLCYRFQVSREFMCEYNNRILINCCGFGYLELTQWLCGYFQLTIEDIRSQDNAALGVCCACGHFALVKWLCMAYPLEEDDVCANNYYALDIGAKQGHPEITQWLQQQFFL